MITLHLQGQLAEEYGDSIRLEAKSPREAVSALAYQCPKYREVLTSNNWHIFLGETNDITENELDVSLGKVKDVYLVPVIQGSSGAFNFVVGALLIGVGIVFQAWPLIGAGVGMMVGGLVQMTTKLPGAGDMTRDSVDAKASFLFSGPTNTATQGAAIPRGYGRMMVGSVVISVALYSEQIGNLDSQAALNWPGMFAGSFIGKLAGTVNLT